MNYYYFYLNIVLYNITFILHLYLYNVSFHYQKKKDKKKKSVAATLAAYSEDASDEDETCDATIKRSTSTPAPSAPTTERDVPIKREPKKGKTTKRIEKQEQQELQKRAEVYCHKFSLFIWYLLLYGM